MKTDADGRGRIELRAHDPRWFEAAAAELDQLRRLLGSNLVQGEHIGSTSIPGIVAKPIIDLLPVVASLSGLDEMRSKLEELGYEWRGEFGIPGRRFCLQNCPDTGDRLFNIHFFEAGSPEVLRHLAFRDYLRNHPDERHEYEAVKRRAAELCPENVFDYNDAKSDWIKASEQRALAWVQLGGTDVPCGGTDIPCGGTDIPVCPTSIDLSGPRTSSLASDAPFSRR